MSTIFDYALSRLRGQILAWSLGLFLLGWPILAAYNVVQQQQDKIAEIVKSFGPLISAMGGDPEHLAKPANYLSMRYFAYLPLILGIYALLAGSGLVVGDEEKGTLDLILAHPVSRTALFLGRFLAFLVALLVILAVAWLGLVVWMTGTKLQGRVSWHALLLPFLSLLALLLFFYSLAVLLSLVLPSRRLAATVTGMFLVASFFLTMLARINPNLHVIAWLSPLHYYQSGEALSGLDVKCFGGLLAAAGIFTGLAWRLFEHRDIRVAGEGVWRWPVLWRKTAH